ncbi:hypothetical protein Zmor_023657 [Zophobas morio]|uniref:THAP-type domain-containing protein n=1 Tax=Zophobas morio TaxID=2755281 RepID=A0AA38I0D4_9CUCU|nr:hypothetical protein Zmor_023657 [Zophobas morio]
MPRCSYKHSKNNAKYKHCWRNEKIMFRPMSKPTTNRYLCEKWIKLCGGYLEPSKVDRNRYICSKQFVGGCGPTPVFPNPIPYGAEYNLQPCQIDNVINEVIVETNPVSIDSDA